MREAIDSSERQKEGDVAMYMLECPQFSAEQISAQMFVFSAFGKLCKITGAQIYYLSPFIESVEEHHTSLVAQQTIEHRLLRHCLRPSIELPAENEHDGLEGMKNHYD